MTRVVVVDDDYMVARVHSAFVERVAGCTVVGTASDGASALRVVRELLPDVVLLDVYMPDNAVPLVGLGSKAIAGETILADLTSTEPRRSYKVG